MIQVRIIDRGVVSESLTGSSRQSCTFPQLCVLDGGRWLCAFRAAPTKKATVGEHLLIVRSDDAGKSWSPPLEPFAPMEVDGRIGVVRGATLTALGGERVLAGLFWCDHSDPAKPLFNDATEGVLDLKLFTAISEDAGQTWSAPSPVDTAPFRQPVSLTGAILTMTDGTWACPFELQKSWDDTGSWDQRALLRFSTDEGKTWPSHGVVARDETNRLYYWDHRTAAMRDGRLLSLLWTYDRRDAVYRNIHACQSLDRGRSWSEPWDTGVPGQPAPAVDLGGDTIAMVYVDRTGAPEIKMRLSRDGGRTWPEDTQMTIAQAEGGSQSESKHSTQDAWHEMENFSIGLPQTAALPDGGFIVVYYAGSHTDRTGIHWVRVGV